jgi:hypothetical protein
LCVGLLFVLGGIAMDILTRITRDQAN